MTENGTTDTLSEEQLPYDEKVKFAHAIAKPMATKSLAKKIYKLLKKSSKLPRHAACLMSLKDIQKSLRRGEKGIMILAGDTTPIDMFCHIPVMCEDRDIPYCYVPSKKDLGAAVGGISKVVLMLKEHSDHKELYDEVREQVKYLPAPL